MVGTGGRRRGGRRGRCGDHRPLGGVQPGALRATRHPHDERRHDVARQLVRRDVLRARARRVVARLRGRRPGLRDGRGAVGAIGAPAIARDRLPARARRRAAEGGDRPPRAHARSLRARQPGRAGRGGGALPLGLVGRHRQLVGPRAARVARGPRRLGPAADAARPAGGVGGGDVGDVLRCAPHPIVARTRRGGARRDHGVSRVAALAPPARCRSRPRGSRRSRGGPRRGGRRAGSRRAGGRRP